MKSYHGFTVKYLKPLVITDKPVNNARIYYKDMFLYEYVYNKRKNEVDIIYNGSVMKTYVDMLLEEKQYAPNVLALTMDILDHYRRQQFLENVKNKGGNGFIDILDENNEVMGSFSIKKTDEKMLNRVTDIFGGADYKLFTETV